MQYMLLPFMAKIFEAKSEMLLIYTGLSQGSLDEEGKHI